MNDDEFTIIDDEEAVCSIDDSQIGIVTGGGRIGVAIRAMMTLPDGEDAEITVHALMRPENARTFAANLLRMADDMDDGEDGERCRTSPRECRPDGPEGWS